MSSLSVFFRSSPSTWHMECFVIALLYNSPRSVIASISYRRSLSSSVSKRNAAAGRRLSDPTSLSSSFLYFFSFFVYGFFLFCCGFLWYNVLNFLSFTSAFVPNFFTFLCVLQFRFSCFYILFFLIVFWMYMTRAGSA